MYPNWLAQHRAQVFCENIAIHADVATAINKMNKINQPNHYWLENKSGYRFIFRGLFVDFAYCEVTLSEDGKILTKRTEMVYD